MRHELLQISITLEKPIKKSYFQLLSGMFKKIVLILLIGFLAWAYQATRPPPPRICGSPGSPPVTTPRIKLRDGRHLAYKEHGVSKEMAKYKIIIIHGFGSSSRHDLEIVTSGMTKELGIYFVSFDRPGYGESDPDPKRTLKSLALNIEELADQLELGSKFYIVGLSMGGQMAWGCLEYIPHRLAGVTLMAPVINYWWRGFPANLSAEAYHQQLPQDQWALRIAHYTPWLIYWWNTQKWFPASSVVDLVSKQSDRAYATQQGEHESLHRDMVIGFGNWEFDPMDIKNPFRDGEGSVHLWHGIEDDLVPVTLHRYIAQKLPWIHYHELPGVGHGVLYEDGMAEAMLKGLLLRDK